uniref:rho guanine nucleotide exchange factor 28-like isoform X2 n=1 Tax=Ciona intestinalis TaxID=7719 RepID=UPI00089DD21E|nr:rho guanine nucleotide exchange factor 28-like isoform X2 [Ciona intestinalis]|eukprot:XP_018671959.1 rho guanine nucleotide exchange factor 28-like isoform X2 [Ciona intestinalis]
MNNRTIKMELLPTLAPVYGGGLIVAFLPEDYVLPENIRAFAIFKGSKQRQLTEARVSVEDNAFHAVIPDHEPPEEVEVSVYIQLPSGEGDTIASERFTYYLDQTCYLARYLAASVHKLESLEDWDYIQGPNFSLEQEDFSTLDERLTSAFQHLILPLDWNLLGDHDELIPRETLFHFAARLGLSTFVTLLLEKNGAQECLALRNRHNELAESIARERGFEGLADLITDPHAHGVIRWESKEQIGPTTVLKQHSFGTISTSSHPYLDTWPPIEKEIEALTATSLPPSSSLPLRYNMNSTWDEALEESPSSRTQSMFHSESYDSEFASPDSLFPPSFEPDYRQKLKDTHRTRELESTSSNEVLAGNLKHLQEISEEIQYLRHKDIERLRHAGPNDVARLSNSCPDLAQEHSALVGDETLDDVYAPPTPVMPRNRRALPPGIAEEFLEPQDVEATEDLPSPSGLHRRHSWHSSESLPDQDVTSPGLQRRFSFQHDSNEELSKAEETEPPTSMVSPTVVRRAEKNNMTMFSVVAPSVTVTQAQPLQSDTSLKVPIKQRPKSISENNSNNVDGLGDMGKPPDRRFTIAEGIITDEHRSSMLALKEVLRKHDPAPFSDKGNSQHPPPVPPKPASKKLLTRKMSFLEKMRNSTKNKPKVKVKQLAELKFGISSRQLDEEETYESTDAIKENNTSKNKSNKRPSIIQRPQSMMLNRPSQYSVGNPPTANYAQQPGRSRPISTIGGPHSRRNTGSNSSDLTVPKDRSGSNRSSYYDDDEGSRTPPNVSYMNNMKDVISASFESLDEAALDIAELEKDPDLALKTAEPEAWSVKADRKTLKKMSKKDVKRQDNIFEFIQTERNYLTTLKIMQKIFARGLVKEAHIDPEVVEKLFPSIDEHVDYVANFVAKLSDRQVEGKVVDGIGDICVAQWSGTSGNNMKRVFGDFCCKQNEIVATHKELYKTDKKFSTFIKKCDKNPLTRRQGIPECALLVTQRVTKYPIMLQTLLENSNKKDHTEDYAELERALDLSREIAKDVDEQVQAHEREQLLYEIYEKTDTKTTTAFKEGRKFARKDLLKRNRKLLYSSNAVQWKISNSKKFTETFFLLLSDCFVLLQENNGKYTFPSGQPAAVPLMRLIVREVANDEKGLYLISTANSQMYELKVDKADDCKTIMQVVRSAVGNCTEEDEGIPSEDEEERKLQEQKLDKARRMIDLLEQKDDAINRLLKQKMEVFRSLAESVERGTAISHMSFNYPTYFLSTEDESSNNNKLTLPPGTPVLLKAIEQVRKMSHAFCGSGGLSRQPSSVGEHESGSRSPSILPKRSDTFGGFDNGKEPSSPRGKWMNNSQSEGKLIEQNSQTTMTSESKRDSGLVDSDVLVRRVDSQGSIHKEAWGINEPSGSPTPSPTASTSGDSYIPPTSDQILTITNLSHLLHSYMSISTQQDTHMEKLQQQLLLVQDKNSKKRGGNLQEVELKRNHIKQQEQLDDLRKQQHQLKIEREQWHRTNERFQKSMAAEKQELEAEKAKIHQEKLENERQRDEIHRAKEDYQREMARLRDLQRRSHYDIHISSSTSSLPTSTVNRNNSNNGADVTDLRLSSGDGKTLSSSKSHSSLHSSSDVGTKGPPSPTYASAADYPRTFPGSKRDSGSASAPSTSQLPLHLQYSATNQLSALQAPRHQEFPSKLSKLASSTKGKPMTSGESKSGLMHQMIPSKLTKLASGQSGQHVSTTNSSKLRTSQTKKSDHGSSLQVPSRSSNNRSPSPIFKNFLSKEKTSAGDSKRNSQSNSELYL